MSSVTLAEQSAASTPSSGNAVLYFKSDGLMYWKDDAGTEYPVSFSGGSGSFTNLTVTGNTILGDAAGDTLTVNAGAWTLGNPVSVTGTWSDLGTVTTVDINGGTIDGTSIGGSTPAAGAFTTLSANNQITSTMGNNATLFNSASATTGYQQFNIQNTGAQTRFGIENSAGGGQLPGSSAYAGYIGNVTNTDFHIFTNNTIRGTFSSTGLSVTGTLSSTGNFTVNTDRVVLTASAPANSLYLNGSGNLGLGTASPSTKLHLQDNSAVYIQMTDVGDGASRIGQNGTALTFGVDGADGSTERMRIDSSGNVGIGTSSPVSALGFGEAASATGVTFQSTNTTFNSGKAAVIKANITGSGNGSMVFETYAGGSGGGERMRIDSSGLSVTGTLSSTGNFTVSGGTVTTGSTTALSLATSGGTQFIIGHAASATDYWQVQGSAGAGGEFYTVGGTNVNGSFKTKGSGYFSFATAYDSGGPEQVRITHTASANSYITLTGSNGGAPVIGTSAGDLAFSPAGSERMRIDSSGNVGIGETAPDYKLDVNGTFGFAPGSSVTPVDNGDVVFELTNNTTLTIKARGSDGTVRSGTVTLA